MIALLTAVAEVITLERDDVGDLGREGLTRMSVEWPSVAMLRNEVLQVGERSVARHHIGEAGHHSTSAKYFHATITTFWPRHRTGQTKLFTRPALRVSLRRACPSKSVHDA
jgi:hypothetical protein